MACYDVACFLVSLETNFHLIESVVYTTYTLAGTSHCTLIEQKIIVAVLQTLYHVISGDRLFVKDS